MDFTGLDIKYSGKNHKRREEGICQECSEFSYLNSNLHNLYF